MSGSQGGEWSTKLNSWKVQTTRFENLFSATHFPRSYCSNDTEKNPPRVTPHYSSDPVRLSDPLTSLRPPPIAVQPSQNEQLHVHTMTPPTAVIPTANAAYNSWGRCGAIFSLHCSDSRGCQGRLLVVVKNSTCSIALDTAFAGNTEKVNQLLSTKQANEGITRFQCICSTLKTQDANCQSSSWRLVF